MSGGAPELSSLASRLGALTLELVGIPSETGAEGPLCDTIEARLRACEGIAVHRHRHSLLAWLPGALPTSPTLALAGHLDTVPTFADTPIEVRNGCVFGAGASDMKGALAVMLTLAEDLPPGTLPVNLLLVFYEAEEGPLVDNGLIPLLDAVGSAVPRPDFAIAMEPTDSTLHLGCVGSFHARVTFSGRKAHSARPWQGENAITRAGRFLSRLHLRPPRELTLAGLRFSEVLTVTEAQGGQGRNVVPDRFVLNVNGRFAPGNTAEALVEELRTLAAGEATVELTDSAPSGAVCADNPWFLRLGEVTGAPILAKQAWTDVAQFSARGIDAVNFGPGLTAQAHQRGEYVPIASLVESYRALHSLLTPSTHPGI